MCTLCEFVAVFGWSTFVPHTISMEPWFSCSYRCDSHLLCRLTGVNVWLQRVNARSVKCPFLVNISAASAGQWCMTCVNSVFSTADCKSLATKPAEEWKTTIDLLRMNLIIFPTSASPTSLIVVFHCSACLLQDFAICCIHPQCLHSLHPVASPHLASLRC